jgi:uncharacterized protein YndB with AHSA1/START domain
MEKGMFTCERVGDTDARFTKLVKAPRALVWRAHTEPALLAQWWGPEGFSHVNEKFEMKVGGTWKFVFTGPDGMKYHNNITFTELKEPEVMAMDHGDFERVHFKARTVLSDHGDGWTKIVTIMSFPKKETRDATLKFAEPGHESTMGRLEKLLATL